MLPVFQGVGEVPGEVVTNVLEQYYLRPVEH